MKSEFNKKDLPAWCEICDEQGIYFVEDVGKTCYVVHKKCGFKMVALECPQCESGSQFAFESGERPTQCTCPICGNISHLDQTIFDHPVDLYIYEELPEDVRARVLPRRMRGSSQSMKDFKESLKKIFPARRIVSIVGALLMLLSSYKLLEAACFPDMLVTDGVVSGYRCQDRYCQTSNCFSNCEHINSIILFRDEVGNYHEFAVVDEKLSGKVMLRYRLIIWPGGINLGVRGAPAVDWPYHLSASLLGFLIFFTGAKGFRLFARDEHTSQRITAILERISIKLLNWICFLLVIGLFVALIIDTPLFEKLPPYILAGLLYLSILAWNFPGIVGMIKTDFIDEKKISQERPNLKMSFSMIFFSTAPILLIYLITFVGVPEIVHEAALLLAVFS